MMAVTPELLFKSLLAGLSLIITTRGLLLLLITIILSILGVFFRTRAFPHLALILMLMIFVLNIHVFTIFPIDTAARNLITVTGRSGTITDMVLGFLARAIYNAGIILIPLLIYLVSLALVGQPVPEE
jgi:hypothetical protein